jgi:hypothetical protein
VVLDTLTPAERLAFVAIEMIADPEHLAQLDVVPA